MPQVVASVIFAGITQGFTLQVIGSALLKGLVSTLISAAFQSLNKPKKPSTSSFTSEARNRTTIVRSPVSPHRVVYGSAQVSGTLVYASVTGSSTKYLHLVIALAGHSCEEIGTVYFNDKPITLADEDAGGNVIAGDYKNHVRFKRHLGATDQAADADLVAEASEWTVNHRLRGRCYLYVRLKQNRDVFPVGIPNIKVDLKGKNDLVDPRDASVGWSENPALCIRDFLLWDSGFGSDLTELDDASWIAAANVCDENVVIDEALNTQPRYTCNGSFTLDTGPLEILEDMLSSMAGASVWKAGLWTGYPGAAEASSFEIGEGDFRGPVRFRNKPGRDERFNAVRGTYVNPDDFWQQTDFAPQTNALYEAEDGGARIYKDIDLPFTIDHIEAQRHAKIELETHRQGIIATLPLKLGPGLPLRVWQVGGVTLSPLGWSSKLFKIIDWQLVVEDNGGIGVDVTVQEYADASYDWNYGEATLTDPAPNTTLLNPSDCTEPSGLTLSSGNAELLEVGDGAVISRLKISFTWPSDGGVERVEVQYKKSSDAETAFTSLPSMRKNETTTWLSPVKDGETYDVRVRSINLFNVASIWVYSNGHTVAGKSEKPPTPDWFSVVRQPDGTREFSFGLNTPPADVRTGGGFRIRARLGTGYIADDLIGYEMHDGVLKTSPWETNQLAAGVYTAAVWAVDSSGNESATPLMVQSTLGNPRINNALAYESPHIQGWPGTKTKCLADNSNNTLTALGNYTWDDLTTWDAWTEWAQSAYSQIIYEHTVIDLGVVTVFLPLVSVDAAGVKTVEINLSDDNVVWSGWAAPSSQVTARYLKVRVTLDQAASEILQFSQMTIILSGETISEVINDTNTSSWSGSAAAGRVVPILKTYSAITKVGLALQNVGPGWTWEILNKTNTGPTIKIYNNGTPADAVVDVDITGLPATS